MTSKRITVEDFDFHGKALDTIFDDYDVMLESAPVGHSSLYGGFTYVAKSEDIFAAEQDPETFSVAPSMMMPSMGTDIPLIPIDIDPPSHTQFRNILLPLFTPMNIAKEIRFIRRHQDGHGELMVWQIQGVTFCSNGYQKKCY